jgi:hypothetical protein
VTFQDFSWLLLGAVLGVAISFVISASWRRLMRDDDATGARKEDAWGTAESRTASGRGIVDIASGSRPVTIPRVDNKN